MKQTTYDKFLTASSEFDEAKALFLRKKQEISDVLDELTAQELELSLLNFYKEISKLECILAKNIKHFTIEKKESLKIFKSFLRSKKIKIKNHKYSVPAKHLEDFDIVYNNYKNVDDYIFSTYKSFIVNATTLFDVYISSTIKKLKSLKSDLFYNNLKKTNDKLFSYTDIFDGNYTILDYEQKYITKHLVSDNRIKQMKWLLGLVGVKVQNIINDANEMKEFIRFTEIRNLLVHNQGKINSMFLKNLKDNQIDTNTYKLNSQISLNEKDILMFKNVLIRIISTLNNHICYFVNTKCDKKVGNSLDELSIKLIKSKDYSLCEKIINDYVEFDKRSRSLEEVLYINLAQIYKHKNYSRKLKELCKKITSTSDEILLCKAILQDDDNIIYEKTKTANIPKSSFYTWPIFQFVNTNKMFLKAFKEKYHESYNDEVIEKDD